MATETLASHGRGTMSVSNTRNCVICCFLLLGNTIVTYAFKHMLTFFSPLCRSSWNVPSEFQGVRHRLRATSLRSIVAMIRSPGANSCHWRRHPIFLCDSTSIRPFVRLFVEHPSTWHADTARAVEKPACVRTVRACDKSSERTTLRWVPTSSIVAELN